MKDLIIVADLGMVKAYVVSQALGDPSPSVDLLQDVDLGRDYVRFASRDEDSAGRFSQGGTAGQPGGMSYGERHAESEEARRTQLNRVAGTVREICSEQADCERIHFAAPQVIHDRLLELVGDPLQARLAKSLPLDIVHEGKKELLGRFGFR